MGFNTLLKHRQTVAVLGNYLAHTTVWTSPFPFQRYVTLPARQSAQETGWMSLKGNCRFLLYLLEQMGNEKLCLGGGGVLRYTFNKVDEQCRWMDAADNKTTTIFFVSLHFPASDYKNKHKNRTSEFTLNFQMC